MQTTHRLTRRHALSLSAVLLLHAFLRDAAIADDVAPTPARTLTQTVGDLALTLRLPQAGIAAGSETVLYVRSVIKTGDGTVETVPFAQITASAQRIGDTGKPTALDTYPAGVIGEYTLVGTFPAAGEYALTVRVTPPGAPAGVTPIEVIFGGVRVNESLEKQKDDTPEFVLKVEATPAQPLPGESVVLHVWVENVATKERVTRFESLYGAPLHLYFVREDTGTLRRDKPLPMDAAPGSKDDGVFTTDATFPAGGAWRIFAEVAPKDAGLQTLSTRITVPGARSLPEPMMAQVSPIIRQNNITLRFARPIRFVARQTQTLTLILEDGQGNPLSDLQPADTALAHLYFVERGGKTFLHAVPDSSDPRNGRSGSNQISFVLRFPKGGTYRVWFIASRAAQTVQLSFVVKVGEK